MGIYVNSDILYDLISGEHVLPGFFEFIEDCDGQKNTVDGQKSGKKEIYVILEYIILLRDGYD